VAQAATSSVTPAADTYVSADARKANFGTATELRVSGSPEQVSYLRFGVSVAGTITRATLSVYANSASAAGFDLRSVNKTNWNETGLTYNNAPSYSSTITGSSGPLVAGVRATVDVSALVRSNGAFSFALTPRSAPAIALGSRESANPPLLLIETVDTTPPAITLTQPANGGTSANPTPTFTGQAGTATGDLAAVTVNVYSGSTPSGTPLQTLPTTRQGDGSYSVPASPPLAPGTYTARAEQQDAAGNTGFSSANAFTITPPDDTTPPAITLTQPANGSTTGPTPTIAGVAGSAAGDLETVTVLVYSGPVVSVTPVQTLLATRQADSSFAVTAAALANGIYTARAQQSDAAGNTGFSVPTTFSVLGGPPPPSPAYRAVVLADSPAAYWRLGELTGTTAADEQTTSPGTYLGGVLLGAQGAVAGDPNTAAGLDGVNDTVRVPNNSVLSPTTALTVEAWVRPTSLPSTSTVLRKESQYLLRLNSTGAVTFRIWKGGSLQELTTPSAAVGVGAWTHLVATWNGSTMTVYVNGTARATRALASPADAGTAQLFVGASTGSYDWFVGRLDEVAIYRSALSAARVQAHYEQANLADDVAPNISLAAPASGSVADVTPNVGGIAGIAPGDSATVTVRVYSGTVAVGTPIHTMTTTRRSFGTFSVLGPALASGTYTVEALQSDNSGNVGRSLPSTFTVNAAADPAVLGAGDIAGCDFATGERATAAILDRFAGVVIPLGDTAYLDGTPEEFASCYDPTWGRHLARTRPAVGDHEYRTPGASGYFQYFGAAAGDPTKGYYSFDLGTWHVVILNSTCGAIGGCHAGSPQETWLRADLDANPAACTLAVIHSPRFSSGSIHGNDLEVTDLWRALYDEGAEVVLSGNDHLYERFAPQTPTGALSPLGIRQFVVGTGGNGLYSFGKLEPNSEARENTTYGVLRVTLRPGAYDWTFLPESGKTFSDSGSASCH
jgi:Concanavalin A-like lectin/glucanases superfamily/Bacterial Ig-like domain